MRKVVVTGGSRGIGLQIVQDFLDTGYDVYVLCNSGEGIQGATVIKCDVSNFNEVKEAAGKIGPIDVLVNNAGILRDNLVMLMSEEEFDDVINVNLKGVFNCCKHFVRGIIKSPHGRIINISSVTGLFGNAGQVNYAASKAGVIGLTKSLAREIGAKGVTVNAVLPGYIQTDMTKDLSDEIKKECLDMTMVKRLGTTKDVSSLVLFLAGESAGYITGQCLTVDGGMTT